MKITASLPARFFLFVSFFSLLAFGFAGISCSARPDTPATQASGASVQTAAPTSIQAPFEKIKVAHQRFVAAWDQPTVLTTPAGSRIEVPAQAFVTLDGQPVDGPVNLAFREFHSAAELLACGIPMRTKAQSDAPWLQTAGMFEIGGTSAATGAPVRVAPGKTIGVDLNSTVDGSYDFWRYDPGQQTWVNQVQGTTPANTAGNAAAAASLANQAARNAKPPVAPVTEESPGYQMRFAAKDLDLRACPDLREKTQKIILLYTGSNHTAVKKKVESQSWDDYTLTPAAIPGVYTLSMTTAQEEYAVAVSPVLAGKELAAAQAAYQAELKAYEKNLQQLGDLAAVSRQQASFRRTMQLTGLGIYNYDIIYHREDALAVQADFDFGDAVPQELRDRITVYLVTADGRAVIAFPTSDWSRFAFRPADKNVLVAVLPGDRVATFSAADFQAQQASLEAARGQHYVFEMAVQKQPIVSLEDLAGVLDAKRAL